MYLNNTTATTCCPITGFSYQADITFFTEGIQSTTISTFKSITPDLQYGSSLFGNFGTYIFTIGTEIVFNFVAQFSKSSFVHTEDVVIRTFQVFFHVITLFFFRIYICFNTAFINLKILF